MFNKNIVSNFVDKHCRRDEMGSLQDQKQVYNDGYLFSHKQSEYKMKTLKSIQGTTLPSLFKFLKQQEEMVNSAIGEKFLQQAKYHLIKRNYSKR